MNRIGMIVDVSHTSAETAADVLRHSKAPVIFSHSNAQTVWNVPRNVPDHILKDVKRTKSLIMATFAPQFVSQSEAGVGQKATLERVAGEHAHARLELHLNFSQITSITWPPSSAVSMLGLAATLTV